MRRSLAAAIVLGFVGFVTSFGAHIVAVNLPVYAQQVGIGIALIGVLIAIYEFAEVLAKPIFGALADRGSMKRTMLASIAIFIAASLAYPFVDPRLLFLIRFLQGVGGAGLSAISLALIGVYYRERRGRAYGIYNAIKGAGYVVSPLVGGAILLRSHFATIFVACAAIGALAFLLSLPLPDPPREARGVARTEEGFSLGGLLGVLREPALLPWYGISVVNMFFVGILFNFLPVRIYAANYDPLLTGGLLSAAAASYLLIQPVAGLLADRLAPARTIFVGLLLAGLSIVAIPFVQGPAALVAASIVAGVGVGTVWTNTDALVSMLAPAGKLGATMGTAGAFHDVGDMLGPLGIGLLAQAFGLPVAFVVCGLLGLLVLPAMARIRQPVTLARRGGAGRAE
jgi:MFS family permease